jgi:hypothetical protein
MPFNTIPRITAVGTYMGAELHCPRCGETYLHHASVTSYDRAEDQEVTRITTVRASGAMESRSFPSIAADNPSGRRNGVAIGFNCEMCDGYFDGATMELTVAQHKGNTFLAWRMLKRPANPE